PSPEPVARCGRPSGRSRESAWQPHRYTLVRQFLLQFAYIGNAEMKDACGERRIRAAGTENVCEMLRVAGASRRDHRDAQRPADRCCQLTVETVARAVGIHRRQQDFACTAILRLACPIQHLAASRLAAALPLDFPFFHRPTATAR